MALRDKGFTELPLAQLNARLAPKGYIIHANKGKDPKRLVACTREDGRVEQFGLFKLWPKPPEASGRKDAARPGSDTPAMAIVL